jgi:hypothetical protein
VQERGARRSTAAAAGHRMRRLARNERAACGLLMGLERADIRMGDA